MKWVEVDQTYAPLTLSEAFYMATKGAASSLVRLVALKRL